MWFLALYNWIWDVNTKVHDIIHNNLFNNKKSYTYT